MAPLPPIVGVAKVSIQGTYNGRNWANIFHIDYKDFGLTQANCDTLTTAVLNAFVTDLLPSLNGAVQMSQAVGEDLSSDTGVTSVVPSSATGGNGTGSTATTPNVAFLVNWKIARRYRGGHPRTYLVGVAEGDVDGAGVVATARKSTLQTGVNSFLTAIRAINVGTATADLATVHYIKNKTPQTAPTIDPVLAGSLNAKCATQRRRLR